ncbi:MAG: alpha/beta hydrolase [Spirochaetaceae bacterium]|nr:MAG: alpha/beta hydrolase [Spirochaetaceae bacterium]
MTGTVRFSADMLDTLLGITAADNPAALEGTYTWQSEISGIILKSMTAVSRLQADFWQPLGVSREFFTAWMQPLMQMSGREIAAGRDPDLIARDNQRIESAYASAMRVLIGYLTSIVPASKEDIEKYPDIIVSDSKKLVFDRKKCDEVCSDLDGQVWLLGQLGALQALEWQYHTVGQTRLGAMKRLLRSLVQVIAGEVCSDPAHQPYRRPDKDGKWTDTDQEYLEQCELRLLTLMVHDAIDIRWYALNSPDARLGACEWEEVPDSREYSIVLRHYLLPDGVKPNGKVLYMASPMINRCEIYDLAPGKSVVEGMLAMGYTIYMVDHGNPESDQNELGLEYYGKTIHDKYLNMIEEMHPGKIVEVMAYCMGGTMFIPYLARRIEEVEYTGKPLMVRQVVLLTTPIVFDDGDSGHKPMRDLIREQYDSFLMSTVFDSSNVPPQTIEVGMHGIQPGVAFSVSEGFYARANFPGAVKDAAPFLHWLNSGTRFPAKAHRQWIKTVFMDNSIWEGTYCLPSSVPELDGKPVDLNALNRGQVAIFDYRGQRDVIAPVGSCITSEHFGRVNRTNKQVTRGGLNRTIEKNVGHIFVVSKKLLSEFLEIVDSFMRDEPPAYEPKVAKKIRE